MGSVHILVLLLSLLSLRVKGQACDDATTCGECYAIVGCAWCLTDGFDGNRCFNHSEDTICDNVENIGNSFSEEALNLTEDNQISLERANIALRVGSSQQLNISVRPAENFPLDLYMLVDLSNSLRNVLTTIRNSASQIANSIEEISSRFQIGFGTYIDKLVPPYVSRVQLDLSISNDDTSACVSGGLCVKPFSYVHDIDLTNSSDTFADQASLLMISTNADNPEGTLDAILQSVVCDEIVGWRENARKILLIITDAVVHSAGDGRIAGIIRPSTSECLLALDDTMSPARYAYTANAEYDYPSVEQVRQVLADNTVSPIFAIRIGTGVDVSDSYEFAYFENLGPKLNERAEVVQLTDNADNIITAITTAYNNLVSQVALSFTPPDGIRVDYTAQCPENALLIDEGRGCNNVSTNQTVTFGISVTVERCTDAFRKQSLQEIVVNIPSYGQFVLAVETLCTCGCESQAQVDSSACNFQGNLTCSVCECYDGWTGDSCTCSLADIDSIACPMGPNGEECSGSSRGECDCGICKCTDPDSTRSTINGQEVYEVTVGASRFILNEPGVRKGNSCECDNFQCTRNRTDYVCSLNGECVCENMGGNVERRCQCGVSDFGGFPYTGDACQCNIAFCFDQSTPYSPNRMECNGNGECNGCNRDNPCTCDPGSATRYCIAQDQLQESCNAEQSCIECISNNEDTSQCANRCDPSTEYVRLSEAVSMDYMIPGTIEQSTSRCTFVVADPLCTHVYFIGTNASSSNQIVYVEPRSSDCLTLQWYAIALILLAGLIILGIIVLIIIKLIFLCLDYKELKKFQKEVAEADLSKNFNPLYQSPNVNYTNVAFGKE